MKKKKVLANILYLLFTGSLLGCFKGAAQVKKLSSFSCTSYLEDKNSLSYAWKNPSTWQDPDIINFLENAPVIKIQNMRDFLSQKGKKVDFEGQVYLIELENNVQAVFKSSPLDEQNDVQAEVAAYKASLYLGFPPIPPTVIRVINGLKGSLQLFIDTPIDLLRDNIYTESLEKATKDEVANLKIFYFVFGQWDTGAHNLLAHSNNSETYLIAIDNAGICNHQHVVYGQLPFVRRLYSEKLGTNDWGKPFPFDQARVIDNPSKEKLKNIFQDTLPEDFYENFKFYGNPLKYVVYNNSLWIQYHAFDNNFMKSYVEACPQKTLETLQKLDLKILRAIFTGADFATDAFLKNILERKEQLLHHFRKN